ncbi:ion transporter [Marinicella gelatinilytica]|uniref:ion transporter n=1 Tax=Marinicella gelatinilytica TaxID=2996017 RepID=UPI002260B161|nr:ion transporter [Marinicella gelatinilytica]MCX7545344.1 ion transporter [Marinicella gelatinilytica]
MNIKQIVEQSDTKAGKIFDLTIQFLIFVSLIMFSVSTIPDLSERSLQIFHITQIITVTIFSLEYLLRIFVADKKLAYIFSFYGVVDLLAILPFYLSSTVDLRSIRILRLFRLFRIFKVVRYSKAVNKYKAAFFEMKEELVLFSLATLFVIYIAAVGIYYFENEVQPENFKSVFHSLWWAVATLTTVGYGDVFPITIGGRLFTFLVLMIGLSIVAVPAGLLASALQNINKDKDKE